jgi:hypothetical protein
LFGKSAGQPEIISQEREAEALLDTLIKVGKGVRISGKGMILLAQDILKRLLISLY